MRSLSPVAATALAVALVAGAAGCGEQGAPGRLDDLLAVMPVEAAERGLFYTRVEAGAPGFGSALPLRRADELLGVRPEDVTEVLESGGAPLTVLAGRIPAATVTDAVRGHGYATEQLGDWTLFTRVGETATGPLAAAVPAGAVRGDLLVLGAVGEVRAAVTGANPVADEAGVAALSRSLPATPTAVALLVSNERLVAAADTEGGVEAALARADARGSLPAWDAAALAWVGDEGGSDGAVLLAYETPVDGHEAARGLVLRAATTPLLGDGRRATSDLFERGAPRWDADRGVVLLPVTWREADPARVRSDVEQGALLFLAPAP